MVQVTVPFAMQQHVCSLLVDDHDAEDHIVNLIALHRLAAYRPTPDLVAGLALSVGGNFLDIGACSGVCSRLYGHLATGAIVYALAPQARP
jgi:hypothetical protein